MNIKYINGIPDAPKAVGPYSQAVRAGDYLFLSGQIPLDPDTGKMVGASIEDQTNQVLKNIKNVLNHLELDFTDVVKTTIFLTDLAHFKIVNEIYESWLGASKPARSTIQVAALPLGAAIEIEMTAYSK